MLGLDGRELEMGINESREANCCMLATMRFCRQDKGKNACIALRVGCAGFDSNHELKDERL